LKIELKNVDAMQAACIFHKGPVEEMGELIPQVLEWVMERGLDISGAPFAVYYSDPQEIARDEWEYEVGVPFSGEAQGEDAVQIKKWPAQQVLVAVHKGSYQEIPPVYMGLMEYVVKEGYHLVGAPMEFYLNSPAEVDESDLLTEVWFPVQK
jgi:AraC family transcriptional regulator